MKREQILERLEESGLEVVCYGTMNGGPYAFDQTKFDWFAFRDSLILTSVGCGQNYIVASSSLYNALLWPIEKESWHNTVKKSGNSNITDLDRVLFLLRKMLS